MTAIFEDRHPSWNAPKPSTEWIEPSPREAVLRVLSNPRAHGEDVYRALELVIAAGSRGSAGLRASWGPIASTPITGGIDALLELVNETLEDLDRADHFVHVDVPAYVPDGWFDFLQLKSAQDPEDFTLPWLGDLRQ